MPFPVSLRRVTIAALVAFLPASLAAAGLTVFAAASLSDALTELAPLYAKTSGDTVRFNFGGSGALARQITEGAPADLFLSADELRADQLEKAGLLLAGTRRTLLANTLVLVTPADTPALAKLDELALPSVRRIAFGDPATVPAGAYARSHLATLKLWESLQPKAVFLENVRTVLAAVEAGNADAGFVYKTDALLSKKVRIAVEIPRAAGPVITYPAAVLKDSRAPDAAKNFLLWLAAPDAQSVFAKYGFLAPQ